jgi:hypothetical protein
MIKPPFAVVRHNYPERSDYPRGKLLELLGWDDVLNNPSFMDTCAMRMSYALTQSGVTLMGARMIGRGKGKGRPIEPRQAALSKILCRMWGEPEKFKSEDTARAGMKGRTGVVSFC